MGVTSKLSADFFLNQVPTYLQLIAWVAAIALATYQLFARGSVRAFRQASSTYNGNDWVTNGHYIFLSNVGRRPVVIAGVGRLNKGRNGLYSSISPERSSDFDIHEYLETQQFVLKDGESRSFYFEAIPGEAPNTPLVDDFAYGLVKRDLKAILNPRLKTYTRKYRKVNAVSFPSQKAQSLRGNKAKTGN